MFAQLHARFNLSQSTVTTLKNCNVDQVSARFSTFRHFGKQPRSANLVGQPSKAAQAKLFITGTLVELSLCPEEIFGNKALPRALEGSRSSL